MSDMESKMQERYDALPYLELEAEIERLERGRDIQKGNAERWEKLAIQYKREIERLENEIKAAIPHNQERLHEMNRLRDELKQANADRKKDCVDFFRWFWNAPGTNTEQGYDEWLAALETDDE